MSGMEVVSTISDIIDIFDACLEIYHGAAKDLKLSWTCHEVARQLPTLTQQLITCQIPLDSTNTVLQTDRRKVLHKTLESCDGKARKLRTIFEEVITDKTSSWFKRPLEHRLQPVFMEELMKEINTDVNMVVDLQTQLSILSIRDPWLEFQGLGPAMDGDKEIGMNITNWYDRQDDNTGYGWPFVDALDVSDEFPVLQCGTQRAMSPIWKGQGENLKALICGAGDLDFPYVNGIPLVSEGILGHGGQAVVERVTWKAQEFNGARKTFIDYSEKPPEEIYVEACTELHHMEKLSYHHHITKPVLAYRDHDEHGSDRYHIVMVPVADGGSLAKLYLKIRRNAGFMTPEDRKTLQHCFGCLTMTMTHIHNACIRYKDVKLENVLVHEGELLFSDFGVAYDFSQSLDGCSTTEGGQPGAQTWAYSAPEVHSRGRRTRKSDMFSLGVALYRILSLFEPQLSKLGTPGFYAYKIEEMIAGVEAVISEGGSLTLPIAVYRVVIAMLMRDQAARIKSTDAFEMLRSHKELFCDRCWLDCTSVAAS